MKIKITIQIEDKKIEGKEEATQKELKTKLNRLFRKLKKQVK